MEYIYGRALCKKHPMLRLLLTLLILNLATAATGQAPASYRNQLKVSPMRLLDPVNPGVEVHYERVLSPRYSAELTYGYMTPAVSLRPTLREPYKGTRLGLEVKRTGKELDAFREYWSAEVVHNNSRAQEEEQIGIDSTDTQGIYHTFEIHKKTTTLNIKWGVQRREGRVVFDVGMGVGVKYRDIQHTGRQTPYQM